MNRINIIGRLTADPELKSIGSGIQVCTFTVAVNRRFNKDETDFFPVTVWRDAAVNCNKYLAKGSQVGVSGSLQIRHYEDKDGVKRTAVDLQADEIEFLGMKNETKESQPAEENKSNKQENSKQVNIDDLKEIEVDNMPF